MFSYCKEHPTYTNTHCNKCLWEKDDAIKELKASLAISQQDCLDYKKAGIILAMRLLQSDLSMRIEEFVARDLFLALYKQSLS